MIEERTPRYIFKICLVGSGGVGKTCMARRLCLNTFSTTTQLTVGIDFYTHDIPLIVREEETFVRLSIWDFGGQEQFKTLFGYYISGANGIFLVFDLLNMESLTKLEWWYDNLKDYNLQDHPKILVGTKHDLVQGDNKKFKVDKYIIEQFLQNHNEKEFVKTSSKENQNILYSFKEMTKKIIHSHNLDYDKFL
ncbi:MAG: GTP-binding protein [Candidatus Lokiarchaeota archaeon]|nr:GTP-binding protein [Candidatus Lokiarchaeota archaeon]